VKDTAQGVLEAAHGRRSARRLADPALVLSALPVAVVLLDAECRFLFANPAAEQFLGVSTAHLSTLRLSDLVPSDNPLFLLIEQVRAHDAPIADHDLTLESPRLHKTGITALAAPLPEEPGTVVLALQDASAARTLDRQLAFRGAARSVTGMAAILAHEVKNPLSGIRGAAQLLQASVTGPDLELTELIRDEADRIRGLVDRMEMFGEKPLARSAVNIHRVLAHVRRLAQSGFGAGVPLAAAVTSLALSPLDQDRSELSEVAFSTRPTQRFHGSIPAMVEALNSLIAASVNRPGKSVIVFRV